VKSDGYVGDSSHLVLLMAASPSIQHAPVQVALPPGQYQRNGDVVIIRLDANKGLRGG
jgi:hypothetical protein